MKTVERTAELFWSRVTKTDGCWTHSGSLGSHGYPQATGFGRYSEPAHRVSWLIHHGSIPAGLFVCHRCNNRLCVRPDHLYVGTHKQNMDDMARVGHPRRKLTEDNVREIRSSRDASTRLAARMGVTQRVVWMVRQGLTYRHVA